ncbi:MAG: DEAD/DEAH box helicase [Oscillospiraceae bacterium]|jgi:ATP-dependent Lhr-like helicase|nr:DEAD/DEAH box helicase [Oscillospiraceae bacterium]
MATDPLALFHSLTSEWFRRTFGAPTSVQREAWRAVASDRHTLVSAPTGTGKTLSAFLVFIDRLKARARSGELTPGTRVIYVSPLKSLAGDIRENLRRPLDGITAMEREAGLEAAEPVTAAIRTGDTTTAERRRMIKHPPHILITTPESLYLMLTSASGRGILRTAETVIIDELHAVMSTKRGAHLTLSLARLDALCGKPLQRVGLSATVSPLEVAAAYLAPDEVVIAAPKSEKAAEIAVISPMPDSGILAEGTIWPELARAALGHTAGARTTIAFCENRRAAERLAYEVNQIAGEGYAATHHGSMNKERRLETESSLRAGALRMLVATSSMELGIDVGAVDAVLQIGNPRGVSSALQRLGRAGHTPNGKSVMIMLPRMAAEALSCGLTAQCARLGLIERLVPPTKCLDVLAQHLVSMAACGEYTVDDVLALLPRAYPFRDVTREELESVLRMLAGDWEHRRDVPVRPRLLYDRVHGTVSGDAYSRMLAISTGGTIPDRGMYSVKSETGVKLGELDEEFVFEARVGDKFLLGAFAWRIKSMDRDAVTVAPASVEGASPPFWKGDWSGRPIETGLAFGQILRELGQAAAVGELEGSLVALGLDERAARAAGGVIENQLEATGVLPDDRTVIVERFTDDTGIAQMMIHSVFGRRVNAPLALLARETLARIAGMDIGVFDDEDGFLLFPYSLGELPKGLLFAIDRASARNVLAALLPATPLFSMSFRYNAARALMMGVRRAGRTPLWVQRLRGAEMLEAVINDATHPLVRETTRECMEELWDVDGALRVLEGIATGAIAVREVWCDIPSPMSLPFRRAAEAVHTYDYAPTPQGIVRAVTANLDAAELLPPSDERLEAVSAPRPAPVDETELHTRLMIEGDAVAGELDAPIAWLQRLARRERALYIEPGLWIAAEHREDYALALEGGDAAMRERVARRALRYRGAQTVDTIAERYFWESDEASRVLTALTARREAVEVDGTYYHAELYERARRETVTDRRARAETREPAAYARLATARLRVAAPAEEQLVAALKRLRDEPTPIELWENVILPARVTGYRSEMLDKLLAAGEVFWHVENDRVSFRLYADIDYEAELPEVDGLSEDERLIYDFLRTRGASFTRAMPVPSGGASQVDALLSLAAAGLIHADSFVPIRRMADAAKLAKSTQRQRTRARTATLDGRWEVTRPQLAPDGETAVNRAFDRAPLLCRETVTGMAWGAALEVLRVWEYTGRARRGYFVRGLSGAQYIREGDWERVSTVMKSPADIVWLNAVDPAQPWGKALRHSEGRAFIAVSGTVVALKDGLPVAVLERRGAQLRVFDDECAAGALAALAREFKARRILPDVARLTVKSYPAECEAALSAAGFTRVMSDFALYRGV